MKAERDGEAKRHAAEYCAFKEDRFRVWALVSRDVRLVLVVLTLAFAGNGLGGGSLARLLQAYV